MQKKIKIAFITTWFSPTRGVAVNRMEAFSQFLDKDRFEVTFFVKSEEEIVEEYNGCKIIRLTSSGLLKLPDFGKRSIKPIHYLKVIKKQILLRVFKIDKSWGNKVFKTFVNIQDRNPFDVIVSCYAPKECLEIGYDLKLKYPGLKWVLDNRDEMSGNPSISNLLKNELLVLEKKYNELADIVVSVSKPVLQGFIQNMPKVKRFEIVHNGFNHDLYNDGKINSDVFTINYVGSFYGTNKPDLFLSCVNQLKENKEISEFKIRFVGAQGSFSIPEAIKNKIEFVSQVDYQKVIKFCDQAHLNLLLINFPGRKGVYSGKIYDYISVGRPILALVDKTDVAADLLNEVSCNFVVDPMDENEIKVSLLKAYSNWQQGIENRPDKLWINQHHRKIQVEKFNNIIASLFE